MRLGRWSTYYHGGGELELMTMADAHSAVTHSRTVAAVAVKRAAVVVSMTYGIDGSRWRVVGGAMVVAGHGRARSLAAHRGHGGDGDA